MPRRGVGCFKLMARNEALRSSPKAKRGRMVANSVPSPPPRSATSEQPASQTPNFSRAWSREIPDQAFIHRTISRWRLQQR